MKSNKHLSLEERSKISVLQSSGESVRSIARILGRSPSTISRELNRPQVDNLTLNLKVLIRNNRPMKILNYMTPKQKLQHFSVAIAS